MPLIIPKNLPAYDELQQENVFVMHQERAMSQHIRPLRILILNLMHEGMSEKIVKHISHAYRIIYQGNTSIFDALLMIKDQVPMSDEIQHIIDFISASKLGIIK